MWTGITASKTCHTGLSTVPHEVICSISYFLIYANIYFDEKFTSQDAQYQTYLIFSSLLHEASFTLNFTAYSRKKMMLLAHEAFFSDFSSFVQQALVYFYFKCAAWQFYFIIFLYDVSGYKFQRPQLWNLWKSVSWLCWSLWLLEPWTSCFSCWIL